MWYNARMALTEQEKIDELLKLGQDNNRMLHRMRRGMIWGKVLTLLYWAVILGGVAWSYYYVQPYITGCWDPYRAATKTIVDIQTTSKALPSNLQGLLDNVR